MSAIRLKMMIITAVTISHAITGYGSLAKQRVDEVEAHPVEREDRLGDDRAAEDRAEVERDERDERDQRVPERVLHRHPALVRGPSRERCARSRS